MEAEAGVGGQPRKPDLIVKAAPLLWCEKARFVETSD
jgi:hypothetical protein